MKFDCKIKVRNNFKKISEIQNKLPQIVKESVEEVIKNIRGYAIRLEKGHNEDGILVEMVNMSTKQVKGRVYADPNKFMTENNQSYLWFEYFGTRTICRNGAYWKNKAFYRNWIYRVVYTGK